MSVSAPLDGQNPVSRGETAIRERDNGSPPDLRVRLQRPYIEQLMPRAFAQVPWLLRFRQKRSYGSEHLIAVADEDPVMSAADSQRL